MHPDPARAPTASRDPNDDSLLALAREAGADRLVSGDHDLLTIVDHDPPVVSPRALLDELQNPTSQPTDDDRDG